MSQHDGHWKVLSRDRNDFQCEDTKSYTQNTSYKNRPGRTMQRSIAHFWFFLHPCYYLCLFLIIFPTKIDRGARCGGIRAATPPLRRALEEGGVHGRRQLPGEAQPRCHRRKGGYITTWLFGRQEVPSPEVPNRNMRPKRGRGGLQDLQTNRMI